MSSLENNEIENIHVIHKSLMVLLFKGLVAWLMVAVIYLIGGIIISSSNTVSNANAPVLQSLSTLWTGTVVSLIVLFLYGGLILYITLEWILNYYILNSNAVTTREGIIFTKEGSYDMARIESVEVNQGIFGRLFNFGTLVLFNPALERELKLRYIPDPHKEAHFMQSVHPNPEILNFLPKRIIK